MLPTREAEDGRVDPGRGEKAVRASRRAIVKMSTMRILLWHGYLLGGTGSNVYTRALAREWSRTGHDVVVLCQEPHPSGTTSARRGSSGPTSAACCPSS